MSVSVFKKCLNQVPSGVIPALSSSFCLSASVILSMTVADSFSLADFAGRPALAVFGLRVGVVVGALKSGLGLAGVLKAVRLFFGASILPSAAA